MAVIALTQALANTLGADGVKWGQQRYDIATASDGTGNGQDRLGGPPRWRLSIAAPAGLEIDDALLWETLLLQLRGRVNHLSAWDPKRPAPRGTARGTMTLNGAHALGATTLNIIVTGTGQVGNTLLPGDPLQVGTGLGTSQLVRVVVGGTFANTAGNSTVSVTVEAPLRTAFSGGATVTWDKALAYFKTMGEGLVLWTYHNRLIEQGFALDLIERWN